MPSDAERKRVFAEMMAKLRSAHQDYESGKISEAEWSASSYVYNLASIYVIPTEETASMIRELLPAHRQKVAAEEEIETLEALLAEHEDEVLRQELEYQRYLKASLYLAILDTAVQRSKWERVKGNYRRAVQGKVRRAEEIVANYYD